MEDKAEAIIFLASRRIAEQIGNAEINYSVHETRSDSFARQQLKSLKVFSEITIAPRDKLDIEVAQDRAIILLPIAGDLDFIDPVANVLRVEPENMLYKFAKEDCTVSVENPFAEATIQFIYIELDSSGIIDKPTILPFDLKENNSLVEIKNIHFGTQTAVRLFIGKFDGRAETEHLKGSLSSRVFTFVIAGAFEFQSRLLERGDGLLIWNTIPLELEALSNEAIILLLEIAD